MNKKLTKKERAVNKLFLSNVIMNGPFIALVTCDKEYKRILSHLKVESENKWLSDGANGCMHLLNSKSGLCCIVAIPDFSDIDVSYEYVLSIMCHESVHVFQAYCRHIGEAEPSIEFEAYSIQAIFKQVLSAYSEKFPDLAKIKGSASCKAQ